MIEHDLSWIERRKESVVILDDTALRRQISVDFSLRGWVTPLHSEEAKSPLGDLFCAPVFVLPKSPSNLMAFDLLDEEGRSLWLISREDNARISAAGLLSMARRAQPELSIPDQLEAQLRRLATADATTGGRIAHRLLEGPSDPWPRELDELRGNLRFCWWLETLAHSSIVVVLFRSLVPRRKLVKLTFQEPIQTEQRWMTKLGWAAYKVGIDTSLFEARSSHFEAEAPRGLRISEARLTDNEHTDAVRQRGFLRRVHLYRPRAEAAGAATAVLWLVVSGGGFVGGAWLSALLTFGALVACAATAGSIAANPTSAPALLLVLPGLIASYVARPDQHALTTRLLSFARLMLMFSALCAYVAAAKVALGGGVPKDAKAIDARADSLRSWLIVLAVVAGILLIGLSITYLRGKVHLKRIAKTRFRASSCLAVTPAELFAHVLEGGEPSPAPSSYQLESQQPPNRARFIAPRWHGTWFLSFEVEEIAGESVLAATGDYVSRLPGSPAASWLRKREAKRVDTALRAFEDWNPRRTA